MFDLTGLTALVTGGGKGLGKQLAEALVSQGATTTICGRDPSALERAVAEIGSPRVVAMRADITNERDVGDLAASVDHVDILVNNAAIGPWESWLEVSLKDWRDVMALNVEAPLRLAQLFAPRMSERGFGRIVNVASVYSFVAGDPGRYPGVGSDFAAYIASKHALLGLTRHLAVMLGPSGVTVNALSPGMFPEAGAAEGVPEARLTPLVEGAPLKRAGRSGDLNGAVVFLASHEAAFVSGQNIVVDGGWTAW